MISVTDITPAEGKSPKIYVNPDHILCIRDVTEIINGAEVTHARIYMDSDSFYRVDAKEPALNVQLAIDNFRKSELMNFITKTIRQFK